MKEARQLIPSAETHGNGRSESTRAAGLERLFASTGAKDFDEFWKQHEFAVIKILLSLLKGGSNVKVEAGELANRVAEKAWSNAGDFKGGSVKSWLGTIAYRLFIDEARKRSRQPVGSSSNDEWDQHALEMSSPAIAERSLIAKEQLRLVLDALKELPKVYRNVVYCTDVLEMNSEEVLKQLNIDSMGTLKSRLNRGRELLKKKLKARGIGPN